MGSCLEVNGMMEVVGDFSIVQIETEPGCLSAASEELDQIFGLNRSTVTIVPISTFSSSLIFMFSAMPAIP